MATDATGTPTTLGIPTYNINVDAPSGNGFNAAMAVIDSLLQARATLASPAFTGTPTAPTPVSTDNSTALATTAFVKGQGYLTAALTSFNGRTAAAAVPTAGDYTAAMVTNAADKSSAAVQAFSGVISAPNFQFQSASPDVVIERWSTSTLLAYGPSQPDFYLEVGASGQYGHLNTLGTGLFIGASGGALGFFGTTPTAQPTTAVASANYASFGTINIKTGDTFDGYTVSQVVKALRNLGILA